MSFPSSILPLVVVVVAILLGYLAQQKQAPPPFSTPPCIDDAPLNINLRSKDGDKVVSLRPCRLFSETYAESRHKFRQAAVNAGAELHRLVINVPDHVKIEGLLQQQQQQGDHVDTDYTIDIAVLYHGNSNNSGLAVHTSGVHGVEGYGGSPIQIGFLETVYPALLEQHGGNTTPSHDTTSTSTSSTLPTIVLIHAVNPFGMAHYRRTNEHNVDLNRNALSPEEWKPLVTNKPTTHHQDNDNDSIYAAYRQLESVFNPTGGPPSWLYVAVTLFARMIQAVLLHGFDALKTAMVTGQYYQPKGIFYGGNQLQPSLQLLYEFFRDTLLATDLRNDTSDNQQSTGDDTTQTVYTDLVHPKTSKCCQRVVTWIDVHTGLGASGVDTLLGHNDTLQQQAPIWFPGAPVPQLSKSANDVHKGYHNVKGFTSSLFRDLFARTKQQEERFLSVTQEFGTVPGFLVAHALIVENRAFHYAASRQEALEWSQATTKRAFYKQTPTWRRQVLDRGMQVWLQAIHRSSQDLNTFGMDGEDDDATSTATV